MSRRITKEKPEGYVFGRPTLYKDKYIQMMEDYFNVQPNEVTINRNDKAVYLPSTFPTKDGFACQIGVHRDTLYESAYATNPNMSLKHPEFSDAYKRT